MSETDPPPSKDQTPSDEAVAAATRRGLPLALVGWCVLGVVALGVAWIVVTGLLARSKLEDARAEIADLRKAVVSGRIDDVEARIRTIAENAADAHALTTGPAWWVTAHLPGLGTPLQTSRVIAAETDRLGRDVLPGVLRLARTLPVDTDRSLDSLDLTAIARAAPDLHRAAASAASAYRTLAATDGSWLPAVSDARNSAVAELSKLDGELVGADRAVGILLPMLGQNGLQRYYLGFLNEAESRGGGGIPGAFAIATADHGRIRFEKFGTDLDLSGIRADVDLGPELQARYGNNDPTAELPNSNLSPDFSVAARIWAGLWTKKTGERVDGALAVDPTALSYLLAVTGPASLPDGTSVSSQDIVSLTQKKQYALYPAANGPQNDARKRFLTTVAKAVSTRLTSGGDAQRTVRALSRAAGERRLLVWSRTPSVERELRAAGWAGELGNDTGAPYSGFVVNNAAGSKLDYYLDRTMTYRRTDCGTNGQATATIRLTNDAPRSGLPAYVTFRADKEPAGTKPGDNRLLLTYYADRDARIRTLTVNGRTIPFVAQPEGNTLAVTTTIELPVQSTTTVAVTVAEPAADGPVQVLRQPLVRPLTVDLSGDRCR